MATTTTNPGLGGKTPSAGIGVSAWPRGNSISAGLSGLTQRGQEPGHDDSGQHGSGPGQDTQQPSHRDALQALLAFSALHEQVRKRKALAARHNGFEPGPALEFEPEEQFILDEVLQLVAERAVAITGADGLAIALAENDEIILRASAGTVRPDVGARIDRDSAFSGACFRSAQIVNCDDTEVDPRVNLQACRKLGARSIVAVPLCGRRRVIGLLEAFSTWPFSFNDSDVRNLSLLAELVVGALKPEDEDRFAESAQVAATRLETPAVPVSAAQLEPTARPAIAPQIAVPPPIAPVKPPVVPQASVAPLSVTPARVTPAPVSPPVAPVVAAPNASAPLAIPPPATLPTAATKPVETKIAFPPIPKPPAIEKAPELETAVAAKAAPERALIFGQPQTEGARQRPGMLVLLIGIVIAAAFAAGVVWKWNTAKLGSLIVHTEKTAAKPAEPANTPTAPSAPQPAAQSPVASATTNAQVAAEASEPTYTPATVQELAKFPLVSGIRHWSSADSSTVVLDLEDQVQYEAHRLTGPDRIYFDLRDTRLAPELTGKSIEIGDALINRVRVAQPMAGMTRVVLETKPNTNFSVSLEPNPYRLVVEVRKMGVNPKGAVNLFPNAEAEKRLLAIVVPPPTKEDLQLRARVPKMKIVVDAGHGGWDLGTVGRRGLLEKDLVLEIAERLGKLLHSRLGSEVIYTRQDDNYVSLDERASIANQAQADLFVSVHANYSDLPSARGVETYYTNAFSAPGSKEAGSKEAGSKDDPHAAGNAKNAVTPTLSPADLHERIEQSRRLAASVQRSLYGTLSAENPGLRDRGIKEAGFVVLTESAMPGILAEVSFVSSPTDEQKLRSDLYREQIAEALYRGIARYAASSKGVKVASAGK